MSPNVQGKVNVISKTFKEFIEDDAPHMAAALAYYTVFSLPPLLLIILTVAGFLINDPQQVQQALQEQISGVVGEDGAQAIGTMIQNVSQPGAGSIVATILGIAGLIFGATGAFAQLQTALNKTWEVEPDPEQKGAMKYLRIGLKRLFSLAMVLVVAFLLLVSLVLSAALSVIGDQITELLPTTLSNVFWQVIHIGISLSVITLLFAAMFKILPDARIPWRHVWVGALVTAVLFEVGKFLIGFYIGQSNPGSAFGAAGSLVVILVWIYYSSLIFFLGAEFTQVWARRHGESILPAKGAVRVVEERRFIRDGSGDGQATLVGDPYETVPGER